MATKPMGALAMEEPGEAAENESADYEQREQTEPGFEGRDPRDTDDDDSDDMPSAEGLDPRLLELVQLVVARTREALVASAGELDTALKADPVQAGVEFGVRALRAVVGAAEEAGKPLSFEVVINAGIVVIQDIASIAVEKGYLADGEIETFLKEVFQQSIAAYARMDMDEGKLTKEQMAAVTGGMGS